ncbi:hypothetical protein A2U01_0058968 [Trifolium medium]|uniref:Uncharacterized protein n=1 Tax=Trifolium medium TaxID=97028 RepID=A0A392RNF6_9FABA|nr:hypothetical protein [Trifolium medium]
MVEELRLNTSIGSENGLEMYLNLSVRGEIPTEDKNSAREMYLNPRSVRGSIPKKAKTLLERGIENIVRYNAGIAY